MVVDTAGRTAANPGKHNFYILRRSVGGTNTTRDAAGRALRFVAIRSLRDKRFPTHHIIVALWLLGFALEGELVRTAWSSLIKGISALEKRKTKRAERRRGNEFLDPEDRASYLSPPIAIRLSKAFQLKRSVIREACTELFPLHFIRSTEVSIEAVEYVISRARNLPVDQPSEFSPDALRFITKALQSVSMSNIAGLFDKTAMDDLLQARSLLLQFAKEIRKSVPALKELSGGLSMSDWLTVWWGPFLLDIFAELVRNGKRRETAITIQMASDFIDQHEVGFDFEVLLKRIKSDAVFRVEMQSLLGKMSDLWGLKGFPLAYDGQPDAGPLQFTLASYLPGIFTRS
jgi:hypothetical protein